MRGHVALVTDVEDDLPEAPAVRPAAELVAGVPPCSCGPLHVARGLGRRLLQTATAFAAAHDLGLVLDVVDRERSAARTYADTSRPSRHLDADRTASGWHVNKLS